MLDRHGHEGQVPLVKAFRERPVIQKRRFDVTAKELGMCAFFVVDEDVGGRFGKNVLQCRQNPLRPAILDEVVVYERNAFAGEGRRKRLIHSADIVEGEWQNVGRRSREGLEQMQAKFPEAKAHDFVRVSRSSRKFCLHLFELREKEDEEKGYESP
jgi:hypothetical protein